MTKNSNRIWYIVGCIALTLAIAFVGSYAVTLWKDTHKVDAGTDAPATDNGADDGASDDGEHIDGETVCLHEFDLIQYTPATCTETGYEKYECLRCKAIEERTLEMLEHSHEVSERVEPTCTLTGSVTYTCVCGDTYDELIEPLGHVYETEVLSEPTCTETGTSVHTCLDCGDIYEETLFALGHTYEITTGADGETGIVYTYYTCTDCGHVETLTEPCEHVDNNSDNICDNCGMANDRHKKPIIIGE